MNVFYREYKPKETLRSIIKNFFVISYDVFRCRSDYLLPTGLSYLFHMQPANDFLTTFQDVDKEVIITNNTYLGTLNSIAKFQHESIQAVGMVFYPIYIEMLFDTPAQCCLDQFIPVGNILNIKSHNIHPGEIMAKMETLVLNKLNASQMNMDMVSIYDRLLSRQPPYSTVNEVVRWTGYSERHIRNLFNGNIGISPKRMLQLIRFHTTLDHIYNSGLTFIPDELGYCDLSHMVKDFKKLCDKTPGELRADINSMSRYFRLY